MSGLTKKTVLVDRTLSALLGVAEGELVSYAQLSKGLHEYIRANDLRNPERVHLTAAGAVAEVQEAASLTQQPALRENVAVKKCKDCNSDIPTEAIFCDICGVSQQ